MMDAYVISTGGQKLNGVFISAVQADHYGGYARVITALKADIVLTPACIEDYWDDIAGYHEVGHA